MIELSRGYIRLNIEEPQEGYTGSRFDWTGKLVQLWWKDIPMCTSELSGSDSDEQGKGFFNEFGIDKPIGYDETKVGKFFPKIGVGMLRKENNKEYDFFNKYDCLPFEFATDADDWSVTFKCINRFEQYAFLLKKTVTLTENGLVIDYQLENRGKVEFNTSEYVHNFISPGKRNLSDELQLTIGKAIDGKQFSKGLNPNDCLSYSGNKITWKNTPMSDFFFENISEPKEEGFNWRLINKDLNVSISETVDFKPEKINLWGRAHVVSPELFKTINLKPGKTERWQRVFEINEIEST
ncbi:hypothetical protein [Marinilabilia rubra]|uniref:Uncharacterized protein n=1 Tax=Marinilabilia rubra TaxID=2162893 RepID=A0A2U2BAT5_9BACT|nr:hypothetical protein [Marinilabilia rubra]PWE00147.1 hypothetical protein DDZ16_07280 [Marinilabilia rubra]